MKFAFILFAVFFCLSTAFECGNYSNCDECVKYAGCQWAPRVGRCMKSDDAASAGHPIVTGLSCECLGISSCEDCAKKAAYCAWCQKSDGWYTRNMCVSNKSENEERCDVAYASMAMDCPKKKVFLGKKDERVFA
uniref:PSI domain-containing protein n=1 Tax=Chromera velia CCMP2878 TaxID=1169474 RepID=A0A0G4F104_9ALVE|eukprot:Cvel_14435.t1-p1 / transcript=Cvel_14435.t1 / gene=Cvel_14435 / organism=Chromera_velia_CCMP2878 / gene_product=hypothetical protein / transcript_product=hypothetical protein / location=Cvel_scaffold1027:9045-10470(+) / protein_length=134 / sequence_SO=supercontig / SO=protein_coding / is_pseudo=false